MQFLLLRIEVSDYYNIRNLETWKMIECVSLCYSVILLIRHFPFPVLQRIICTTCQQLLRVYVLGTYLVLSNNAIKFLKQI